MVDKKLWFLLAGALLLAGCNSCRQNQNTNTAGGNANVPAETAVSPPPFQTKEPTTYQATVVITTSFVGGQGAPLGPPLGSSSQFVARDGDKRRLDYEPLPGRRTVIITTPNGEVWLYPAEKLYAEAPPPAKSDKTPLANEGESLEDFSPEKLLNPQLPGAHYEKLGAEAVNGRAATKYRSTITTNINGKSYVNTTLIWVDDELGLPVKEESTSSSDGTQRIMEYREIKTQVDAALFDIPKDYRKVSAQELRNRLAPQAPNLSGRDRDEAPHDETHLKNDAP